MGCLHPKGKEGSVSEIGNLPSAIRKCANREKKTKINLAIDKYGACFCVIVFAHTGYGNVPYLLSLES